MIGWPVAWKCFVACLFLEESQQPTWPHVRQRRSCTQSSPLARHSSHPVELGVTGRICLTCGQLLAMTVVLLVEVTSTVASSHLLKILVNKLDCHRAFANGRGDTLDGARAHVSCGEHARAASLEQKRVP